MFQLNIFIKNNKLNKLCQDLNLDQENLILLVDLTTKEVKLERNLKHKGFLIILKYIPHITALLYMIYTLLSFVGIDSLILGQLTHISIIPWLFMYLTSYIFRYCYVHRLPLYYIIVNDLLIDIDYYIGIPIEDIKLLLLHLTIIIFLIFGYSYYYIKTKRNER